MNIQGKKQEQQQLSLFGEKHIIFVYLYNPLLLCKIKKQFLRADPELQGGIIFGPKMAYSPRPN